MILPYIYFGALFICAAGIVYLVVTDIVDRVREHKEMQKGRVYD